MDVINIIFTAVSLFLAAAGLFSKKNAEPESAAKGRRIILLAAAALALAVRIYRFGSLPGGVNQDEALAAVEALSLSEYGTDRFGMPMPVYFTAWGYGQMSVMMSCLMVPFIRLFGLSAAVMRLPVLIVSLAGLVFLYLFTRDSFGNDTAAAVLCFAAVCPWHIMQSRWALDCNMLPHFLMAALWLLNRGASGKPVSLYASMVLFGLSMYCYGITVYVIPLLLVSAAVYMLARRLVKPGRILTCACVYLLVAWPFILCVFINALGLETVYTPLFTIPYFPGTQRTSSLLFYSENLLPQLAENFRTAMKVIFSGSDGLPWNDIPAFGTLYLFTLPFTLTGLYCAARDARKNTGAAFLLILFGVGLVDALVINGVNVNRVNFIFYAMIVMTGIGIMAAVRRVKAARLLLPVMLSVSFVMFSLNYFGPWADRLSYYFMEDFGAALTSVRDCGADEIWVTPDSQAEGTYYVSEVLTLYYHQIDSHYFRGLDNGDSVPYSRKYIYRNPDCPDPSANAVYVVRESSLENFSPGLFSFSQYGTVWVVRPRYQMKQPAD